MTTPTARVTCITKPAGDERHEHITHIGGDNWYITVEDAIQFIKQRAWDFYVQDEGNQNLIAWVQVIAPSFSAREHIRTYADGRPTDNLLHLPRT